MQQESSLSGQNSQEQGTEARLIGLVLDTVTSEHSRKATAPRSALEDRTRPTSPPPAEEVKRAAKPPWKMLAFPTFHPHDDCSDNLIA